MDNTTLLGISVFLSVVGLLIVIGLQHRQLNAVVAAMQEINNNPKVLDLVESAAVKVVPAELVAQILTGLTFLKTVAPTPELKALVDQAKTFTQKTTDGLPNETVTTTTTTTGAAS